MIEPATIETRDGETLEAELFTPDPTPQTSRAAATTSTIETAVVIAHPNPVMGGDMYTPVPSALFRHLDRVGAAGLRFNFRGVGRSTGTHDHGRAEQLDIAAAVDTLAGRYATARIIVPAGPSALTSP